MASIVSQLGFWANASILEVRNFLAMGTNLRDLAHMTEPDLGNLGYAAV